MSSSLYIAGSSLLDPATRPQTISAHLFQLLAVLNIFGAFNFECLEAEEFPGLLCKWLDFVHPRLDFGSRHVFFRILRGT